MSTLHILVVDDDRDFAESLADILEMKGHRVELACNAKDALRLFKEQDFDITFMDVKLPGKNGVESLLEIRKIKPSAKVVMITGYSVTQLLNQALESGAWDTLLKPLDLEQVLEMLEKIKQGGILVADDDPEFMQSVMKILEDHDYRVQTACNGQEAVNQVRAGGVDVLVLDLRMPVLNGLGTCLQLKKAGIDVPTIIVTAYKQEETDSLKKLRSFNLTGILSKPFDPQELLRLLAEANPPEQPTSKI